MKLWPAALLAVIAAAQLYIARKIEHSMGTCCCSVLLLPGVEAPRCPLHGAP